MPHTRSADAKAEKEVATDKRKAEAHANGAAADDHKTPTKRHKSDAATAVSAGTAAAASTATTASTDSKGEAPDSAKISVDTNGKETREFRNYTDSARQAGVERFYREQHSKQTYDFVCGMEKKYSGGGLCEMGLWECLEFLDSFVDDSDPDTENSQMQHALQTAEAIRAAYPEPDMEWFPLTGLIHDLGKLLSPKGGEPQFTVVGDTHPVGCAFAPENVFHHFFEANPDSKHPVYSTVNGIYTPNCGLDKVKMSYGHDEYLYQVVTRNGCTLPSEALAIIRFHSFYPMHQGGAYRHLMNDKDLANLKWVKAFQKFDLYSKAHTKYDPKALKPVYQKMIEKYFPNGGKLKW